MRATVLTAVGAALLAGACGAGEVAPTTPATSGPIEPVTSTVFTEPVTTGSEPESQPALEDGRHFGYIESAQLTSDPRELVFDLASFLSGEEANQAAAERGFETPVPNDYFVVNDNPRLRTLPVSAAVEIDLVDWRDCCDKRLAGDPARFEAAFAGREAESFPYRGASTSYWLTVESGAVTRIEEQYLP